MPTTLEYAQLSLRAYAATDENRTPLPSGWTELEWTPDTTFGFPPGVYRQGNEIVISYTGTNETLAADFSFANIPLFTGQVFSPQVPAAMLLYLRVKAVFPTASISFTGHSMGGGLASMMAAFFDRPAQVFDAAPFERGALNWLGTYAAAVAALGYTDPEFDSYRASVSASFAARESLVENRFVAGEFVTTVRSPSTEIGSSHPAISVGTPTNVSAFNELHSMAVLASMLTSTAFAEAVRGRPALLDMLFDPALYYRKETSDSRDLLRHLYASQVQPTSPAPLLDRFAADLLRVDASDGMTGQPSVQKALTVAAMEYYYFNAPAATTQLFTAEGNGIHFNYTSISNPQIGLKSPRLLAAAMQPFLSPDEWAAVGYRLDTQDAWHIQSGSAGMIWTASGATAYDAAIGGAGIDVLDGGAGDDILIGGAGRDFLTGGADNDILIGGLDVDVLEGGAGSDRLLGGAGVDIYRFSGLWGNDTIEDSGNDGVLEITGVGNIAGAGAKRTSPTSSTWQTDDKQYTYTLVNLGTAAAPRQNLVIGVAAGAHAGTITVRNWSEGHLGISLGAEVAAPATTSTLAGDYAKATNAAGDLYLLGPDGNYLAGAAQADAPGVLNGSAAADWLQGAGGNDGLAGAAGDDLIEGGAGDDLLLGGWGADTLNGGAGNDLIFGSALGSIARPTAVGFSAPVVPAGTVELARGFSWVAYGYPGDRIVGDTAYFRTPQVVGASLFAAVFENGQFVVEASGNLIDGGAGNDTISAGTGADIVHGGEGDDDVTGMDGADVLFGDAGDFLYMHVSKHCIRPPSRVSARHPLRHRWIAPQLGVAR